MSAKSSVYGSVRFLQASKSGKARRSLW